MSDLDTLQENLKPEDELKRLRMLLDSFAMLNSSLELDRVLTVTLERAGALLGAEMGSLALLNDAGDSLKFVQSTDPNFATLKNLSVPLNRGIAGYVARTGESVRVEDTSKDDRFYDEIDKALHHTTHTYLCVPLVVHDKIIGTAQLMNRLDGKPFTTADEKLLIGFARQASLAIHNARMHQVMMKQQAMDSELNVCNEIQMNLYPAESPTYTGYELYGETVPCREVGGDYYTYIPRTDGTMDAVLGDVSGKGVSAAMLVSEMHTGIHLLSRMDYPVAETVTMLNSHLHETIIPGKFITFFIIRLHPGDGKVEYVDAGHPPPYIIRKSGEIVELQTTGPILGISKVTYSSIEAFMGSGDLLVAFSDAYSESQSPVGDLFGEERIAEVVSRHKDRDLVEIADILKKEASDYRGGALPSDDSTILLVRRQ